MTITLRLLSESSYLGTQSPLGFKPCLENVQKGLDNQYLLESRALPSKKSGLQDVKLSTEVAGAELVSADRAWVKANYGSRSVGIAASHLPLMLTAKR
jgi:hypothetical protein